MRWLSLLLPLTLIDYAYVASVRRKPETSKKFTIQMIGYSPTKNDDYVAVSMEAPTGYIVGFEPVANADRVHHILLYGCTEPYTKAGFWVGQMTCRGGTHILYAWARNAPDLNLPTGVGFGLGDNSPGEYGIKYLVLQVHYAAPFAGTVRDFSGVTLRVAQEMPANLAAVYLFASGEPIPPRQPHYNVNMSCTYRHDTVIHPFAFRTHTHGMGRVVSAFYKREGQWTKIGKRNPQWPQLFEEIPRALSIQKGDLMAASCRFDSSGQSTITHMGAMGKDEMCNFYMMVHWKSTDPYPFDDGGFCSGSEGVVTDYPKEGIDLLPPRPELEHHAHQSATPFGVVQEAKISHIGGIKLGQVSGMAFDKHNTLLVFHRADRVWNGGTFDSAERLVNREPIKDDVILFTSFTGKNATLLDKAGSGMFYLPHGIFVDEEDAIYVTDVGAHTVSKYRREGRGKIVRVWVAGEELVPGRDTNHFCKPTSVTRIGESLFVADGYCNNRVVELTLDGKYKNAFASNAQGDFSIPHDIVATKDTHQLIIADRQNGRVHQVRSDGSLVSLFQSSNYFTNVYSVDVHGDNIFWIPGEVGMSSFGGDMLPIQVFAGRMDTGLLEFSFLPDSEAFGRPHILRFCPHGEHVYIGDITENESVIWKFKIQREGSGHEDSSSAALFSNPFASSSSSAAWSFVYFVAFAFFIACMGVGVYRRVKSSKGGDASASFNRKGFQPLRTEERAAGLSSDESDVD